MRCSTIFRYTERIVLLVYLDHTQKEVALAVTRAKWVR